MVLEVVVVILLALTVVSSRVVDFVVVLGDGLDLLEMIVHIHISNRKNLNLFIFVLVLGGIHSEAFGL